MIGYTKTPPQARPNTTMYVVVLVYRPNAELSDPMPHHERPFNGIEVLAVVPHAGFGNAQLDALTRRDREGVPGVRFCLDTVEL